MDKWNDFILIVLTVFLCVCMVAITWVMWKPILIDQKNLTNIAQAINIQAQKAQKLEAEIATLKIEQGKFWEKKGE